MVERHQLSDAQWELVAPLLPKGGGRGRPWHDHRRVLGGMLWVLRTGAPWRDLPEHFGKWKSVHARFARWRADGTWDRLLSHLQAELDAAEKIDWELWCIDGSHVRASRAAAGARKKGAP